MPITSKSVQSEALASLESIERAERHKAHCASGCGRYQIIIHLIACKLFLLYDLCLRVIHKL